MKLRTIALALALSCGATTMVQAATHRPFTTKRAKTKPVKMQKSKRYKQSNASKVKPRKPVRHK